MIDLYMRPSSIETKAVDSCRRTCSIDATASRAARPRVPRRFLVRSICRLRRESSFHTCVRLVEVSQLEPDNNMSHYKPCPESSGYICSLYHSWYTHSPLCASNTAISTVFRTQRVRLHAEANSERARRGIILLPFDTYAEHDVQISLLQ